MRASPALVVTLAAALGGVACSKARPLEGQPARVSWQEEIAPLLQARCTPCHSGTAAAGGYRTSSYLAALGPADAPVAVAGDPDSLILRKLDPARADATHAQVADTYAAVRAWVVEGRVSYFRSGIHEGGILNPKDPAEFHGAVVHKLDWNLGACAKCHGADFAGGTSGVSCTQCHTQGPTACNTCHGQPPASGAHVAHAAGAAGKKLDCGECHVKPASWDDPGHLTKADGKAKDRATVTFGAQAALPGPGRAAPPSWDGATCSNVQCHGGAFQDAKAWLTSPTWAGGPAQAACGSCHGLPPASHDPAHTGCTACHQQVALPAGGLNARLHADGIVQVGDGAGTCSSCHGSAQSAAPPRDLAGKTDPSSIGVGAHQAHVTGEHGISAPIACSACHVVPAALHSPGHIDSAPPAEVTFSGLAVADGAAPAWSRSSASCSASYCHGGGQKLAGDTAAKLRTPVWTLGTSQAFCGSCHGIPPSSPAHAGVTYPDCSRCHANTATPNGGIIVSGPPAARTSAHLNGVIDVTP